MLLQTIESSVTKFAFFFRLALGVTLILLVGLETAEFRSGVADAFHISEIITWSVLLGLLGLLVEVILHAQKKQQHIIDLLHYKHKMSLQLLSYQSWESLAGLMARQVAEVVDARAAYLFLNQPMTGRLELIGEWTDEGAENERPTDLDCMVCRDRNHLAMLQPHQCDSPVTPIFDRETQSYCFPLLFKNNLYAVFRFFLDPGHGLAKEQQDVLANISDEVIISLMAGQDRKRIAELELAKTALAERHSISHYLHDNLGQNLGYLRMKLEHFVNEPALLCREAELLSELKVMKDVADESYRFVRNKLEVTIPDSTPLLVNYLQEHAKKVAQRSNIAIQFTIHGTPTVVSLELQQACFFIFQEALSNVEKHSHASKVEVCVNWGADQLVISIVDDGTGFDIQNISTDQHFGLEIMRERIAGIGGAVEILSFPNAGTTVRMNVPMHGG